MVKQRLSSKVFPIPMPTVLVGTKIGDKENYQTTAFIGYLNSDPIILGIGVNKQHFTAEGIEENQTFSVNIPSKNLIKKTDFCGIVSGRQVDKAKLFSSFYGDLKTAPMIEECLVVMECQVIHQLDFGRAMGYFGEVKNTYVEDTILTNGIPDLAKYHPLIYSKPDNKYWLIGKTIANAYKIGKTLNE